MLPISISFVLFPLGTWGAVAGPTLFAISPVIIVVAALLTLSTCTLMLVTWCTEPGILPAMAVRENESSTLDTSEEKVKEEKFEVMTSEPEIVRTPRGGVARVKSGVRIKIKSKASCEEKADKSEDSVELTRPLAGGKTATELELGHSAQASIEKKGEQQQQPQHVAQAKSLDDSKPRKLDKGLRVYKVYVNGRLFLLPQLRAKYCRQTRNIVENFDHYCPWIGNAVGIRNYKYFFAFLTSAILLCALVAITGLIVVFMHGQRISYMAANATVATIAALSGATLSKLWLYNVRIISANLTTNEDLKGVFSRRRNPHDKGCLRNWQIFCCRRKRESYYATYI